MVFGTSINDAQPMCEINITPLVDVMLVLTVLFIFVAPLLTNHIDTGQLGGCALGHKLYKFRTVDIVAVAGQRPSVELDGLSIGLEQLALEMKIEAGKGPDSMADIYLRTAPEAAYSHMVKILALIHRAGIQHVQVGDFTERGSATVPATSYSLRAH